MSSLAIPSRRPTEQPPPLFRAKLVRPNLGAHVLERPRLVRLLADHADRPLLLLVAEAGYGKSTLLTAYAKSIARPVVWYSLMPSDADPVLFSRYLLEGFRRETPRFGRDFERVLEETRPGSQSAETLGGLFANELATLKGPPTLLVLDDFQEVAGNPQVVKLVDTLLRHLPATTRMLIASRTLPPLSLERMRARGEAFEVDSSQLRLTGDELGKLFRDVYKRPITDDELVALETATLGWPTAVHLVHESLRRRETVRLDDVLSQLSASNLELHDYLSSEIYARLDEASRRLLERTAALLRFDQRMAEALSGIERPQAALDQLVKRGLLRTFGIGAHAWYECHDLVRRFVRQEIESRDGADGWRTLEGETAEALEARGETEASLGHYLHAGRSADAARLLRLLAPFMLKQGRAAAVLQYLADLPAESVREDLPLAIAQADAHRALGAWDEAEARYHDAVDKARGRADREMESRAQLGLGNVLNLRGKHEHVLGMAERALAQAHDLGTELRVRLVQMKAGAHFYLGQYQAAVRLLEDLRGQLEGSPNGELLVPTMHNLAMAFAAQGRFREASRELRAALAQVRGTSSPRAPLYLSNLAFLLAEQGELGDARRAAEEGLQAARRFSNRAQETTCHQALAQVLAESGDLDGALAALRRADELNAELRMDVITAELLALKGRIFCGRGEYRRGVEFLNEAIAHRAVRPDDPRLVEYRATLAWCELRAGRLRVAREILSSIVARADADENEHRRMRVHYWLAETALALGDKRAIDTHLATALALVRERGYLHFLKVQAREEPAPLLHALEKGIELTTVSTALVEAGNAVEEPLLEILGSSSTEVGEAAIAVLGEVGGALARARLEKIASTRRTLKPAIRTAIKNLEERLARGAAAPIGDQTLPARLMLFGPPQLCLDGRPVPASAWRAQRAFQMLVYLALHPRGANKDSLLERFWPGRQAAAGRRNFHPTLSYIRKVLPSAAEPPILREAEFYRLNPAYPLTCDAWDLDRALSEASGTRDATERREALARAAALASGAFLDGLYHDWADELQARTRSRVEKLLLDLGGLCARAGDFEEAHDHFRRAAELDEYREATRLAVIECQIRLGNRRAAVVEYERLKTLLRTELQVDPLPETQEAMDRLLEGKGVHGWPESGSDRTPQPKGLQRNTASTQVRIKAAVRGSLP